MISFSVRDIKIIAETTHGPFFFVNGKWVDPENHPADPEIAAELNRYQITYPHPQIGKTGPDDGDELG